jgi:hypothetical protein
MPITLSTTAPGPRSVTKVDCHMRRTERRRVTGAVIRRELQIPTAWRFVTTLSLILVVTVAQVSGLGPGRPVPAQGARAPSVPAAQYLGVRLDALVANASNRDGAAPGTLQIDPSAGPPGTAVLVGGSGFAPGTVVMVTYVDPVAPATAVLTATVTTDGALPLLNFVVPQDALVGSLGHVVASIDSATVASVLFGVTPFVQGLDVANNVVPPGGFTQLSGSGFAPNSTVAISLCDVLGEQIAPTQPITTTSAGVIPPMSISIPLTATAGTAAINVVDGMGNAAGVPLTIASSGSDSAVHLTPAVAALGETVRVAAGGFSPNEPIQLYLNDASAAATELTASSDLHADATGALSGTFTLPIDDQTFANPPSGRIQGSGANAGSLLQVVAKGEASGATVVGPLMVPGSALTVSPAEVASHHTTMVSGKGYYARETITISAVGDNGAITQLGYATASAAGSFSIAVTAPEPATAGPNVITFTVSATGEASDLVASAKLATVSPAVLAFSQYVIESGKTTRVQGTGFAATTPVTVTVQAPWSGGVSSQASPGYPLLAMTDPTGAFSLDVTVPADAAAGSGTFRAVDASGRSAIGMLTVANFPATLHVSNIIAGAGTAITVKGGGFAAGETIDLFLAPPSIPVRMLAGSARQVTADAQGSFDVAYPLGAAGGGQGAAISTGGYMLWAHGELSARQATHGLAIQSSPTGTPGPTVQTTGTPTARSCTGTSPNGSSGLAADTIAYFANGTTMVVRAAPGLSVTYAQDLHIANVSDQSATVTVMYLIASGSSSPAIRQVSFEVPAHGVVQHSINKDVGGGHTLSIMVRTEMPAVCPTPSPTPASCSSASGICDAGIHVTLLTRRTLQEPLNACSQSRKDDPATIVCTLNKGSANTVTRMLDASATTGSSESTGRARGGAGGGPSTTWRFAEGNTGASYQDIVDLLNPQTVKATVRITLYTTAGSVSDRDPVSLGAFMTESLDVRAIYLKAIGCLASGKAAAKVPAKCTAPLAGVPIGIGLQSTEPIVAERTLSWGSGQPGMKAGYDVSPGAPSPSTVAHFAYASTLSGDQSFLALVNPSAPCAGAARCTAHVTVTAYSGSGLRLGTSSISVEAGSRSTLALSSVAPGKVFALSVRSSVPLVAEVTQYVGGPATKGEHPGFEAQGSAGSTQLTAMALQNLGTPILVRVFNPTGSRMFVRIAVFQGTGAVAAPSGYWVGGQASLEMTLPVVTASAGAKQVSAPKPMAVAVTCSGVCVAAVLEGVRGATEPLPAHTVAEALSSSLD